MLYDCVCSVLFSISILSTFILLPITAGATPAAAAACDSPSRRADLLQRRSDLLQKLVRMERKFVDVLTLLNNEYVIPIKEKQLLPDSQITSRIFLNAEHLLQVHAILLKMVTENIAEEPNAPVGAVLLQLLPYLKLHIMFFNSFEDAVFTIDQQLSANVAFRDFCRAVEQKEASRGRSLRQLLNCPIVHIIKLTSLLEALVAVCY